MIEDLDEVRLVRVLGRGGMGEVFLGYDTLLERDVAIKLLRDRVTDEDARLQFLIEARVLARLAHPNVVAIFRASTTRTGRPYLVQELVRGQSLDQLVLPLAPDRALAIGLGLARGLAAAHRRGILHCDVKPANVMIDDEGTPKLLDFGVAKLGRRDRPRDRQEGAGDPQAAAAGSPAIEPHAGAMIGTPRYRAPELWRGEPATVRGDLYSFGAVLYELVAGAPPHAAADPAALEAAVTGGPPPHPVHARAPALDGAFAEIIMACLARDPADRPESADELAHRIERILVGAPPVPEGNPYPGLAPFTGEHRAVFHGRGGEISTVVDRLRSAPLVVVAGDAGIGKSSLCRAGVLPAVVAGSLGDRRSWRVRTIVVGRHAAAALRAALDPTGGLAPRPAGRAVGVPPPRDLASPIDGNTAALSPGDVARAVGASHAAGAVIFLDQLEALITRNDPAEAAEAAAIIASLARGVPGVKLLIAVRADFLTRVAALPALGPLVARSLHLLRVLSPTDLRDAVTGPARAKGVAFETTALVDTLAASIAGRPGALPLLSFALAELWQRRDVARAVIPAAALDAIGGVAGGLARHADAVLETLAGPAQRAARRIALLLVTPDGTRAERDRGELCPGGDPAAAAALDAMVRGHLVVARDAATGAPIYELAHDALITAWPTLRGWRDDVAAQRGLRARLAAAADDWRRLGHRRDALWRPAQLAEVATLDDLAEGDRRFVAASRAAARRRRAGAIALAAGLPAVAIAAWLGIQQRGRDARDREVAGQVGAADRQLAVADVLRAAATADRSAALGRFDDDHAPDAGPLWARATAELTAARAAYASAATALEGALRIDGARGDVRDQLARTIYDQAELAELAHDAAAVHELATRLAAFDAGGRLVAAWRRPAALRVTAPGAVHIDVRRYADQAGHLAPGAPVLAADASQLAGELAPGAYLIELRGSDGVALRSPVLVARGAPLQLAIPLPRAARVAPGTPR